MISIKNKKIFKILLGLTLIIFYYINNKLSAYDIPFAPMSVSLSSNGQYAISSHHGKLLTLWDLKNKTSQLISTDANIYSAYFIPNSDNYIWQNIKTDTVYVQNTKGQTLKTFNPGFASYGQLLNKTLNEYTASDKHWNIFTLIDNKKKLIKQGFNDFYNGKNINLSWHKKTLLTSGICDDKWDKLPVSAGATARDVNPNIRKHINRSIMNCVVLWNYKTGKALFKLNGNAVKTQATLSPDGKYAVSADENSLGFVWRTLTGEKLVEQYDLTAGKFIRMPNKEKSYFEKKHVIPQPKNFCWQPSNDPEHCHYTDASFSVKFINNDQYLRFTTRVPYAILYDVLNPAHKKYLKLEGHPSIYGYNDAATTATAPDKNLLVMGTNISEGIRVYQFDRKRETLTLVWAPDEIQRTLKQKIERVWSKLVEEVSKDFSSNDKKVT